MLKFNRWRVLVLLAVMAAVFAGAWFVYFRGPSTPAELASYLPDKGGTLVYVDVEAMRRSGILGMLAGSKAAEEPEYKDFEKQTGFDYRHDLDAIAATFRGGQSFFAVRGTFDWGKLREYVLKHGGACKNSYCSVDGSRPSRRVSFYKLGSKLMALSMSTDDMAAYQISRNASKVNPFTPDAPVWVLVPSPVLKEAGGLPAGLKSFAIALEDADRAVFSIGPDGDHLKVSLNVTCKDADAAANLLIQLENTTNTLRKLLARAHQEASPKDLSGVLVAGSFRRDDRRVLGQWPIQRVFVEAMGGGIRISGAGVLCVGNLVADIQVRPVEEPGWGKTTWVETIELNLGGNGASTSFAMAQLGATVRLFSAAGRDDFGERVLSKLQAAGVDTAYVGRSAEATPTSVVLVNAAGVRALLHRPGASRDAFPSGIELTAELARGFGRLHLANIFTMRSFQKHAAQMLRQARELGLATSMDTGWDAQGLWMETIGPCLPYTDLLFVNEDEARELTGSGDPREAAAALRERGAGDVVVKLGGHGCLVAAGGETFQSPGFCVEAVDSTGAGDCFVGGFLVALGRGFAAAAAARFANAVGACSVSSLGAVTGLRSWEETMQKAFGPPMDADSRG